MDELEIVDSYLMTCVNLQLAVAKDAKDGKMEVRALYKNLKDYSTTKGFDLSDFNYANFLNFLNAHRDQFSVYDGEIGVEVNLIALKGKS